MTATVITAVTRRYWSLSIVLFTILRMRKKLLRKVVAVATKCRFTRKTPLPPFYTPIFTKFFILKVQIKRLLHELEYYKIRITLFSQESYCFYKNSTFV